MHTCRYTRPNILACVISLSNRKSSRNSERVCTTATITIVRYSRAFLRHITTVVSSKLVRRDARQIPATTTQCLWTPSLCSPCLPFVIAIDSIYLKSNRFLQRVYVDVDQTSSFYLVYGSCWEE